MRTIRRINKALALLLVLVMALTVIPMSAMADEPSEPYLVSLSETVEMAGGWHVAKVPAGTEVIKIKKQENSILAVTDYDTTYGINAPDFTDGWWDTWTGASYDADGDCFIIPLSVLANGTDQGVNKLHLPADATYYICYPLNDSWEMVNLLIQVGGTEEEPPVEYNVTVTGSAAADVTAANKAEAGKAFSFTVTKDASYEYTVTAKVGGVAVTLTENDNTYTIAAENVTGDIEITVEKTAPAETEPTNFATVTYATGDSTSATGEKELIYHTTAGTLERYFYTMSLPYGAEIESIVWDATNTYASRMFAGLTQALNPEAGALPAVELYLTDGEFTDGTSGHAAYKAQYNTLSNEAKAMILDHNVKGFIVAATIVGVAQEVIFVQISTSENGSQPTTYNVTVTGGVAADITAAATATEFEPYSFTLTKPWAYRIYDYDIAVTVGDEALPATGLLVDDSSYSSVNTAITYTIIGDYVDGDIAITANRAAPYSFPGCETQEKIYSNQLYTVVAVPQGATGVTVSRDSENLLGLWYDDYNAERYYIGADGTSLIYNTWEGASFSSGSFTLPFAQNMRDGAGFTGTFNLPNSGYVYYLMTAYLTESREGQILIQKPAETYSVTVTGSGAADVTSAPETVYEWAVYQFTINKQEGSEYTVTAKMGSTDLEVTEEWSAPGKYRIDGGVITGDVTITVEKTDPSAPSAQVVSASLTLKGDIGVNYYVVPNAALLDDTDAYAQFTYKGVAGDQILLNKVEPNEKGEYCFTQYVAAKEMTEQIALRFYTGDGEPVALTNARNLSIEDNAALYSVARYIANAPQDAQALAGKLASYGAYAKAYFKNQIVTEDTDFASNVTTQTVNETADVLINFKPSKDGSAEGVKNLYVSLTLKSMTTLNIIFELEEGQQMPAVTVKGESYTPEPVGSKYYIRIANIPAKDLDTPYTIKIGGLTLNCSALSYAYNVLNAYTNTDGKEGICNLVRALYEYNVSANEYFSNQNGE